MIVIYQKGNNMTINVTQVSEAISGTVVPSTWGDVFIFFRGNYNA